MKLSRSAPKKSQVSSTQTLLQLALGLADSATLAEDRYWQDQLIEQIETHLLQGQEEVFTETLESLFEATPRAHDALADHLESAAETLTMEIDGQRFTALLMTAPLLAWSRYAVPSGSLPASLISTLKVQFAAHVLADNVRLSLCDYLFSPDQLPKSFCNTRELLTQMTESALADQMHTIDPATQPETNRFLADVRYLLAVAIAPEGAPLFRWQESDGNRANAKQAWLAQGLPNLFAFLPGCASEGLQPNAYHAACRQADQAIRPFAIQASVSFLHAITNLEPTQLQATIAPCYDRRLVEYRIALGPQTPDHPEAQPYHGVVWPVLGEDENTEQTDLPGEIEKCLRACGVEDIRFLDQRFPMEFCDDCGAPFYPNREGELVHTEMPEMVEHTNLTLH